MATLATEMPPLHTAEALAGVTTPVSSQNTTGGVGGPGASGGANNPGIDSTQSPETDTVNNTSSSNNNSQSNSNNTISAAADSSDNQPGTPQPHLSNVNESSQNSSAASHPYANHHIYANSLPSTTTAANAHLNQMYAQHVYSQSNMDLQQQQQQQQHQHHSSYPSYLNSYEQFYQQQQQQQQQQQNPTQSSSQTQSSQQMDFINSNTNSLYSASEYKQLAGVRYHPYLHTPTSGIPSVNSQNSNSNNALDANTQTAPVVSAASSSLMSPRVVSSTSPSSSSNQMHISGRASSIGSMSAGNPSSPNSAGSLQCKKCGIMCTNESELQEHITNVHGASPYGSSGYASSPYIKEEMQQQTPPSQQSNTQQPPVQGGSNPGEILDLDSQKMLYPPTPGSMVAMMHPSLGNSDPLHGLHTMQQRAGMNPWDQQAQEGLPPFLQQQQQQQQQQLTETKILSNHSPYYQSPKQSPYHISNSTIAIKTEYQPQAIIKTEYTGDTQQYMDDKSFDPTAPNQQQQQMMPPAVSSSPAEFPSTTTGGPQDNGGEQNVVGNQQYRGGNFEPPSSSSATLSTGPGGSKAANWKSNEARRPKTYNCTACKKWFTSSGHLKRHYNTTLHKNAVKSSGQPDPATLPISVHHHPARDPSGKAGRRGAAAAAAANAGNVSGPQQQQPPNPVQPPEPPNSPQDYGGAPVAAGGLTPLPHYAATPSPNSMYQQQQQYQQHQYMPQVQSTTNASPQHASTMVSHHLQQQQQHQHQNQQQTQQAVMNGHPNALAGLSVPPTRQQTPMPSSQMRGLLNTTMPSSTATTTTTATMHIIKNKHLEAATMEEQMDHDEEVEELGYLTAAEVKQEYVEETEEEVHNVYSPKADMQSMQGEELSKEELEQESELVLQHQRLQEVEVQVAGVLREADHNVVHRHNSSQLPTLRQLQHFRLEQQHPADMERIYHNTTPNSTHSNIPLHSPLIISHQQYQEQLQQQHQMLTQGTYTLTQTPPLPQQPLQHNIMEHQPYISMPLAINTQQPPSNMLPLQQPLTTEQQLPPDTTIPITNMANMLPPNHHHMQQPQQQHTELQPLVNTQLQQDTINTNIPSHITTTSNITNIPSYHHLQQQGSVLPPLDPTLTYPHTIIGNAEVLTLDAYGNLVSASGQHHQVIQTADGQLVQLISTGSAAATSLYSSQSYCPYIAQRSPQEGDLPPMTQNCQQEPTTTTTLTVMPSSMSYSPSQGNSNSSEFNYKPSKNEEFLHNNFNEEPQLLQIDANATNNYNETTAVSTSGTSGNKRKRNPSTSSSIGANSTMLPSGRIKCLPCDKEFTKICYLTQHNKSFHSGEYPYRCQKCGKRYQSEVVYITHLGKHKTTDKAHKCEICPKQFHHKTDLRRHVEAIHTGNKQHVCDICEKSFCRKDHLRKHMETHNRPRVVTKKINARANKNNNNNNNSVRITKALSTAYKKCKDFTANNNTTIKKPLSSPIPGILIGSQINNSSLPAATTVQSNETNSLSSATTSTPSPLMQQMDDVAADDEELLEDDFDECDEFQDMEENEEFNMPQYEQHVQSAQYNLGSKNQVYQIVEQELPMY